MKKFALFLFMLAPGVLAISSCKKNNNVTAQSTTAIAFKFNNTVYSTSTVTSTYDKSTGAIQLLGTIDSRTSIYLKINGGVKVGTYSLTDGSASGIFKIDTTAFTSGASGPNDTGTINVTSFTNDAIAGTFQFSGTSGGNAYMVTQGTFESKYVAQ